MPRFACPVCGDPNAYPMWLDSEPPRGCPSEPEVEGETAALAIALWNDRKGEKL